MKARLEERVLVFTVPRSAPVNHLHRRPDILCKLVLESFNLPDELNASCYDHDQKHGRAHAHQTHCAVYSNQSG